MKRYKFIEWLFGLRYVLNERTNEIHDLKKPHKNCHINLMTRVWYITGRKARRLVKAGKANGCRFCLKKWDTG